MSKGFKGFDEAFLKKHNDKMIAVTTKKTKYGNKKTNIGGVTFDSKKEANRYLFLMDRLNKAEISALRLQVKFTIVINEIKVCDYICDFVYVENGVMVVEDVKSEATKKIRVYRLKNKLMWAVLGIKISEV